MSNHENNDKSYLFVSKPLLVDFRTEQSIACIEDYINSFEFLFLFIARVMTNIEF